MLLFSSEEHVDTWCRQWQRPPGGTLSLYQGWDLARDWYGPDRREPRWRRPTVEEAEVLFASLGLIGPFWSLR